VTEIYGIGDRSLNYRTLELRWQKFIVYESEVAYVSNNSSQ